MEEEFRCRAINDYYASVTDELDLREGCEYVIMQTSPSGWWYAVDENGEDGWVPSNYLVRIDSSGKEIDEEDYNGDDGKSAEPARTAGSVAKNSEPAPPVEQPLPDEEEMETETYTQNQKASVIAPQQPQQPQQQSKTSVSKPSATEQKKSVVEEPKKTTTTITSAQDTKKTTTQEVKKPQEQPKTTTTTTTKTTTTTTNKATTQPARPEAAKKTTVTPLLTVDDGAPDKPITEWSVDETLGYLQNGAKLESRNDFKMTQACRYLTQLATNTDNCEDILGKGGLDIVFSVMHATQGDVAIQMSCCAACVVLCAHPACKQYGATTNGIFYLAQGIHDHVNYRPFVILAFNAVCNFCHDHPRHRMMALETEVVSQILKAMAYHRGREEGYRVHSAGCLALRNIAADPKGQGAVGPDGVTTIVQGLEEYRTSKEVVEGSMGVLCNLCALAANGEAFVMQGGLQLLDNLYSDPDSADNIRLAAASVLHNLAANQDTALLLSADQGIDLLVKILKKAEVDSVLFLNTLKVLTALLVKLPDDNLAGGNKKTEVILRILQRGLIASINEAVKYDNQELQEICVTILVVMAQTSPKLAKAIADADAPAQLVQVGMHNPTAQTLHCVLAVFFHVSDDFANQARLVEEGIFKFLTSDWYKEPSTREDTVKLACGVFIKFFSNVRNAQAISEFDKDVQAFIDYNKEHRPSLGQLCTAMQNVLKQLDPMTSELHVQETYKKISTNKKDEEEQEDEKQKEKQKEAEKQKQTQTQTKNNNKEVQKLGTNATGDLGQNVAQTRNSETQAAKPTGKTHSAAAATGGIPEVDRFYTIEELKRNKSLASCDTKEAYLNDEDFEKVFGMPKADFYNLRPWKQKQLKKSKGFF